MNLTCYYFFYHLTHPRPKVGKAMCESDCLARAWYVKP